jgi:hypothetical protein
VKSLMIAAFGAFAVMSALPSTASHTESAFLKAAQIAVGGTIQSAHACRLKPWMKR